VNKIQELERRIESEGILQLSSGVFKTHDTHLGVVHKNTTTHEYCAAMGGINKVSAEEYAGELLRIMDAPTRKIIGECRVCFAFICEDENHICEGN